MSKVHVSDSVVTRGRNGQKKRSKRMIGEFKFTALGKLHRRNDRLFLDRPFLNKVKGRKYEKVERPELYEGWQYLVRSNSWTYKEAIDQAISWMEPDWDVSDLKERILEMLDGEWPEEDYLSVDYHYRIEMYWREA